MNRRLLILLSVQVLLVHLYANGSWYEEKLEGWYYFEDPRSSEREEQEKLTPNAANKILDRERIHLKELLSLALLDPTPNNVETYMARQKKWIEQSALFASAWKHSLINHPHLSDLTPTTTHGILAERYITTKARKELIEKLSNDHFLLFFFNGKEIYSEKLGEVVALFRDVNKWKVKAVSLNGEGIDSFPEFEKDSGIGKLCQIETVPTLFVVNPYENKLIPVGSGIISLQQIEENIESQLEHLKGGHHG